MYGPSVMAAGQGHVVSQGFFYMLPVLAISPTGEPPKQPQLHNLLIPAITSSIYKEMYQTN
jgi:hypothetical protein